MSGSMVPVRPVEVPMAALTLARAFADDPVFELLFGGTVPEHRARRFFEIITRVQLRHDLVFRTDANEAVAVWAPPGEWKLSNVTIARNAIGLARTFGRRLIADLDVLARLEKVHPAEPHYYLEFIGTDPLHQGRGMATRLIAPMMARCDTEGVGAYLESSKESNLAFYGRFGFEVTEVVTHRPAKGRQPLQQWTMWRNAR